MKKNLIILLINTLILSSCAIKVPEKKTYTLSDLSHQTHHNIRPCETLLVSMPSANVGYDSKNMLYTIKPYELASFSTVQWAGPPAEMLFPLLIQHIDNTSTLQAAASPPLSAYHHKLLKTHLIAFHQDFTVHPSVIRMAIRADIIDKAKDHVISSKVFSTTMSTSSDTPYAGVIAFNKATYILLDQIAWYCVQELSTHNEVLLPPPGGAVAKRLRGELTTGEPS